MGQNEYPDFSPVKILEINRQAGKEWRKARISFCENNGWDWEGNAYLLVLPWEESQIANLERQLKAQSINLYDFASEVSGYHTSLFGFRDDNTDYFPEMDPEALEICEEIMVDLGIKWNGWSEAASFTIVASEEQLQELIKRLEKPIEDWKESEKSGFPADLEVIDDRWK